MPRLIEVSAMPLETRKLRSTSAAAAVLVLALGWTFQTAHAAKPRDFGTQRPNQSSTASSGQTKLSSRTPLAPVVSASATNSIINRTICTAPGAQSAPSYVATGDGGGIAVWSDPRAGDQDIYAMRVDQGGGIEWPADGVPVCKVAGAQSNPQAVPDWSGARSSCGRTRGTPSIPTSTRST